MAINLSEKVPQAFEKTPELDKRGLYFEGGADGDAEGGGKEGGVGAENEAEAVGDGRRGDAL